MAGMFPKDELIATMRCQDGALLPCKLDWPIQKICYWSGQPTDTRPAGATSWEDSWGIGWRKESPDPALLPFPVQHPLDPNLEELDRHPWPDPHDEQLFVDLLNRRHACHHLFVGEHPFALYERAWLLAGMPNLFMAMADHPTRVEELLDRIGEFEVQIARQYTQLGVEAAWISDDYGMSSGLLFSPQQWRRFIRPQLAKLVDIYRSAGAIVILHSCGNITGLVDDFLELGIDVLDPIQPTCNRLDWIRERTDGRICLCGGVESSMLLADDEQRTSSQTHDRVERLGRRGGYIVGPDDDWDFPSAARGAMLGAVEHHREQIRRERSRRSDNG
ncbi:MAG: hypothetical protein AMXMBFR13_09940 [Phycisphaerae bacterium]